MARSATANMTATARVNDQASPALRLIGKEARNAGQAFQKAGQVTQLFAGAAGQMGGEVAKAAHQVSGLAATLASGGSLGIAFAAATLAAQAFALGLEKVADSNDKAFESSADYKKAEAIAKLDKIERDRAAQTLQDLKAVLAASDAEIAVHEKMAKMLEPFAEARKKDHERAVAEIQRRTELQVKMNQLSSDEETRIRQTQLEAAQVDAEYWAGVNAQNTDEQLQAETEAYKLAQDEKAEKNAQVSALMGEMSGALTSIIMADNEKQRDAAVRAAVSAALDRIQVAAAQAAAEAASDAASSYPWPYNLIIAAAAGASVFGAILAFRAKVLGMASGGEVGGGISGRDSVPAMLTPGEIVMPVAVSREFKRMAEGRNGTSGGNTTIINETHNYAMLDASQLSRSTRRRNARTIGNDQEEIRVRGMIRGKR